MIPCFLLAWHHHYRGSVASDEALDLSLTLIRLGDTKEAAKWNFAVPLHEELRSKTGKSLEWHGIPASLALRCSSEKTLAHSKAFTAAGGTFPKAIRWNNPPFTAEARRKKLHGTRLYDLFLDTHGDARLVIRP
jgi:hypothetical protein